MAPFSRRSHLSRRQFLTGVAAAGAAGVAGYAATERLGHGEHASSRPGTSPSANKGLPTTGGILVLVTLYGGNDGLNTVIPYADAAYHAGRPTLGFSPSEVIALDPNLGLHPSLGGLAKLWHAKRLAIVLGAGYPQPNRSHFRSMDIWQSAVPETAEPTGWLGRWLDGQTHDPMRALSLGPTLPLVLQGAKTAAASIPSGALTLPGGGRLEALFAELETVGIGEVELAALVAQSGTDLLTVLHDVGSILANQPSSAEPSGNLEPGGGAPSTPSTPTTTVAPGGGGARRARAAAGGELATQLDVVARLIKGGAPTQVYAASLGGFDTHANEKDNHTRLMGELDTAITGFLDTLAGDPRAGHIVVATYSEFGRRVAANASGGTDHGTAAPLFVAGEAVKGGFYGEQPSLTDLDQGDLRFSTDFRSVYATLAAKVLGVDPKSLLNGKSFSPLAFL